MRTGPCPSWDYFPRNARPPEWVEPFLPVGGMLPFEQGALCNAGGDLEAEPGHGR
jgi:hypothetical protein